MKAGILPIIIAAILLSISMSAATPSYSNQGQNSTIGWVKEGMEFDVKAIPGTGSWILNGAISTGNSLATQDSSPTGIFWKNDGSKFYEIGYGNADIYSYSCTNSWDLSSCSYTGTNISTKGWWPSGLFWNNTGTRLYEIGYNTTDLYSYDCSTPWDLTSCSYIDKSLTTQDTNSTGMFFGNSGSKFYEIGKTGDKFYGYDCSDPWNLSTCSYNGNSLATQDGYPTGLFWNNTGTVLYEIGVNTYKYYKYDCSDPWNLTSCSYTGTTLSSQDTTPRGMFFGNSGSKLYEVGYNTGNFYSYDIKIPLDTAVLATNESGSYSNISTKDLGGAKTEKWANFSYSLGSDCGKVVGWKQYINDSWEETNTTNVITFDLYPKLNKTSNSTVINSIFSCKSSHNITLQPSNSGDVDTEIIMKYFQRTGFKECNYGAEGSDRITTENLTDWCYVTAEYSDLEAGTNYTIKEEKGVSGAPPSNLPAALGAGVVGTLAVVYAVRRWKK